MIKKENKLKLIDKKNWGERTCILGFGLSRKPAFMCLYDSVLFYFFSFFFTQKKCFLKLKVINFTD